MKPTVSKTQKHSASWWWNHAEIYTIKYLTGLQVTGQVLCVVMLLEAIVTCLTAVMSVQEEDALKSSLIPKSTII